MEKVSDFGVLADKYAGLVDFAIIYVEEAHPIDGWSFKVNCLFSISAPTFVSEIKSMRKLYAKIRVGAQLTSSK